MKRKIDWRNRCFRDRFWPLSLDFVFMIVHYGELVFDQNFSVFSFVYHAVRLREICLFTGFFSGFLIGLGTSVWETNWGSTTSFPTPEMKARYIFQCLNILSILICGILVGM